MSNSKKLKAFSFFHLNLAYSAISVERRKEVVEKCYWPLLKLARSRNLPFGIEASAWTVETIAEIDPSWVEELRDLVVNGPCEFIGCGYAQVIGPLVPAIVNEANLRIGMKRYEDLLGLRPKIALINEQAFSSGLVQLYKDAGYEALIMEWNNPARAHPEWPSEWRYLPQHVRGTGEAELPVIWNESISFQKVQRYVHGEMELDEWLRYFESHKSECVRAFPIYGNDVEVFDFRPGRYMTEAPIEESEWQKIDDLYAALASSTDIEMVLPSEVLQLLSESGAGNKLDLGTAAFPVPVKKQDKYNLLRWAVTGRDDLKINTACWGIAQAMQQAGATEAEWQELCYLWSSDFRTHITEPRWDEYRKRLALAEEKWKGAMQKSGDTLAAEARHPIESGSANIEVTRSGRFVDISGNRFKLRLNTLKGLALEHLVDHSISNQALCGTIHHGYFDHIKWAADYYSGHLIYESPGRPRVTDLAKVTPEIKIEEQRVFVSATISTAIGEVRKEWCIDEREGTIGLRYSINWHEIYFGSLRLGFVTLNPEAFDPDTTFVKAHNGGMEQEEFALGKEDFDHGAPVSFLISANQAFGMTEGVVEIGDSTKTLTLQLDKTKAAAVGLLLNRAVQDGFLTRFAYSLKELDDTCRGTQNGCFDLEIKIIPRLN